MERWVGKLSWVVALALGLSAAGEARGAGWAEFAGAFPDKPCTDGWVSCLLGGEVVTPEPLQDHEGYPLPADMRIGWFDLEPTPSFSQFTGLSEYSTADDGVAVVDVDLVVEPQYPDEPPARELPPVARELPPEGGGEVTPELGAGGESGPVTPPGPATDPDGVADHDEGPSALRPDARIPPGAGSGTAEGGAEGGGGGLGGDLVIDVVPDAVASCDDLVSLEPQAMMGRLSVGHIGCLEASYAAAERQTDKDRISRVLMANAHGKGDKATWARYMQRHLDEVDRSDPDLCYKYALYLSKRGPSRAHGVIKWAEVALENKSVWTGGTYTSRVYSLYKLRAAAAQKLWQAAEEEYAASRSDQSKADVDTYRHQTKTHAREWYEYAKAAGKDTSKALQLCISAAGGSAYCEGS